jgi:hypothetical protein
MDLRLAVAPTRAAATLRDAGSAAAILMFACTLAACGGANTLVPVADLIVTANQTERRPSPESFRVTEATIAGERHLAIAGEPSSRVTWQLQIPGRASLKVAVALEPEGWSEENNGILFRIGIADGRAYEGLAARHVDPFHRVEDRRWIPLTIDLGAYGGFKWSIFYHPAGRTWKLIFNTSPGRPGTTDRRPGLPLWGYPTIYRTRTQP